MTNVNTAFYSFDSQASVARTIAWSLNNEYGPFQGCRLIFDSAQLSSPSVSIKELPIGDKPSLFKYYLENVQFSNNIYIQCLSKSQSHAFYRKFSEKVNVKKLRPRPVIISAFAGVSFGELEGLMARSFADILLLNSKRDFENYKLLGEELGFNTDNALLYGLPQLTGVEKRKIDAISQVCFFEQVIMPATYEERLNLLEKLITYARQQPDKKILIKLRAKVGEETIHKQKINLLTLKEKHNISFPENLSFTYQPVEELLNNIDLCLTVSSTVALEAIARNIPTAIISDFGIRQDYLTSHYVGSGCLRTFNQLANNDIPIPNSKWMEMNITIPKPGRLIERIEQVQEQQGSAVLPLRPLYSSHKVTQNSARMRKLKKLYRDPLMFFCDSNINIFASVARRIWDRRLIQ